MEPGTSTCPQAPRTATDAGEKRVNNVSPVMRLLAAGIPLTLLLDLAHPDGPDSRGILARERRERDEAARRAPDPAATRFTPTVRAGVRAAGPFTASA